MGLVSILSLTLAISVLAASPGPGVVATIVLSLSSGLGPALMLIAGMIAGDSAYLLFAIFGLSFIARITGEMFLLVKILGGIYLIALGVKIWLSAAKHRVDFTNQPARASHKVFTSGLLISLSNPKVIVFYCGFLPTFVDLERITIVETGMVVSIITVVSFLVLGTYAYLASSARRLFTDPRARQILDRAAGVVMIAVGVLIAIKS